MARFLLHTEQLTPRRIQVRLVKNMLFMMVVTGALGLAVTIYALGI